jgi:large repetitive protein
VVSLTLNTTNPTAGTDVAFTASVAPAANSNTVIQDVSVNFGDGTVTSLGAATGTAISLHHVYATGNTYTVTLTATDSNAGVGTAVTTVFVQTATPLTVILSATATPAGANTTETFTATVIGLGNSVVANYHWVFGGTNGTADTTSNQQTRSYVAGSGPFTVSVTVTTSTGAQATGQTVITP